MSKLKMVAIVAAALLVATASNAQKKWEAPADAIAVKNPLAGNSAALADAKKTYTTLCAPCHGDKGRGDGPAAVALNPRPADHSSKAIQAETDGSLYWKLTNGRGAMQAYKTQLTDNQRWGLVNYIRTLKR